VTGTGGGSVGSGILYALTRSSGAAECLRRWEVLAADADPYAFGLYKADHCVVLPLASDPRYLERLQEVVKEHAIAAVLPGTEAEASLLAAEAEKLSPAKVIANQPDLIGLMMDKRKLADRLTSLGIDAASTCPASCWREFAEKHGYPFILKPATSTGGSRGVKIVTDERMMNAFAGTLSEDLQRYIVQEYVGCKETEFTVSVLTDRDGKLIDSIVLQRKLTGLSLRESVRHEGEEYAISSGYSQGFIVTNVRVQAFCEKLALTLGSRGPLNVQLRLDGDRVVVFEVHPRFSGTTPIRADAGFNEPDVMLRNFLDGERFGRLGYRSDLVALRALEHVLVPFAQYQSLGGELPCARYPARRRDRVLRARGRRSLQGSAASPLQGHRPVPPYSAANYGDIP
jgi:carbamoyl-phosphate synthase large subunit